MDEAVPLEPEEPVSAQLPRGGVMSTDYGVTGSRYTVSLQMPEGSGLLVAIAHRHNAVDHP